VPWTFTRAYGCNTAVASEHLLTFRSGAAGFYDLATHSGTGNFGGFRSGCSSNLIAAGGVLNAPDYTRTCTCAYQNQASLALVSMPEIEMWTYSPLRIDSQSAIRRLGLNFGAPGDRRSDDGTLWLEYPSSGTSSLEIPVETEGRLRWFRHHSSRVSGEGPPWVAASGVEGLQKLVVHVVPGKSLSIDRAVAQGVAASPVLRCYTVRLHFVEPDPKVRRSERVFQIALQGKTVLPELDVVAEANGHFRSIVKSFPKIPVAETLTLELRPTAALPPVLCGMEIVAEQP
jgi:hypothetical protein